MINIDPTTPPGCILWYAAGLGAGEIIDHLVPSHLRTGFRFFMAEIVSEFLSGYSVDAAYERVVREFDRMAKERPDEPCPLKIPQDLFSRLRSGLVALLHLWVSQDPKIPKRDLLLALLEEELQKTSG